MHAKFYDGYHGIIGTDPRTAMGMANIGARSGDSEQLEWSLYNPCGISSITIDGCSLITHLTVGYYYLQAMTSAPSAPWVTLWSQSWVLGGWTVWNAGTLTPGAGVTKVRAFNDVGYNSTDSAQWEIDNVTIVITNPPTIQFVAPAANYALDCVIENTTTGDSIALHASMKLSSYSLIVDTKEKIIYMTGNIPAMVGRVLNTIRRDWLPLAPGANVLKFTDVGTDTLTLVTDYEERNL
jgi:hypothetical protein